MQIAECLCTARCICMGRAVCSAAQVEGVVAEVVWRVFACDQGTGMHLAAIPLYLGSERRGSLHLGLNLHGPETLWTSICRCLATLNISP